MTAQIREIPVGVAVAPDNGEIGAGSERQERLGVIEPPRLPADVHGDHFHAVSPGAFKDLRAAGCFVKDAQTGEVVETAPTSEQAQWTVNKFAEKTGKAYEIVSAGDQDAKGHADGSPFKFVPVE